MRRNIENIKTLLKQMEENKRAVAVYFLEDQDHENAKKWFEAAATINDILLVIDSNESFNTHWKIYNEED